MSADLRASLPLVCQQLPMFATAFDST